jgi:hypothetical protein
MKFLLSFAFIIIYLTLFSCKSDKSTGPEEVNIPEGFKITIEDEIWEPDTAMAVKATIIIQQDQGQTTIYIIQIAGVGFYHGDSLEVYISIQSNSTKISTGSYSTNNGFSGQISWKKSINWYNFSTYYQQGNGKTTIKSITTKKVTGVFSFCAYRESSYDSLVIEDGSFNLSIIDYGTQYYNARTEQIPRKFYKYLLPGSILSRQHFIVEDNYNSGK